MTLRPRAARSTAVVAATIGFWSVLIGGPAGRASAADSATGLVDERRCAECHAGEETAWRGSHHDLAMQAATASTVLGDFADATFVYNGTTTRFFRRGAGYFVSTDGPDGALAEYAVEHVFGVAPLQQVLLALPGGRLQAFSIAWDTEQRRWFHLYPDQRIDHRDELHWTQPSQNWNFMCAECHTTGFEKNYDRASDLYASRWFRDDVGCQACHGPGAEHVAWADAAAKGGSSVPAVGATGLVLTGAAAATANVEVEACARCHSRRSVIAPRYDHGKPLLDAYLPATLDAPLYTADGQIHDEVYEYGSFLQSKMAKKGLRCSDCHDPHSLRLRADGNALCATCHNPTGPAARADIDTSGLRKKKYDDPEHHFHQPGAPGSRCVDCHAPEKRYMVVDPRADHSFRIPRPDLTTALGVPNACNGCHADKTSAWAEEAIRAHAAGYVPAPHYAAAIAAGRDGKSGAVRLMAAAVADNERPPIVRATLLQLLARYPGAIAGQLFGNGLRDPAALVRRAAAGGFELLPPQARVRPLAPLLRDPVLAVRIEAARLLTPVDTATLDASDRDARVAALRELAASYDANADREEGRLGLANLYAELGRSDEAEEAYRSALTLYPSSVPAAVNLADFYRARGDDAGAERVLREALVKHPGDAALDYSLALCLVRQGRKADAIALLASAVKAAPDRPHIAYAYAAALADAGRRDDAIGVLERALGRSRGDRDILLALVAFLREAGDAAAADAYLKELAAINPADPALTTSGSP